MRALTRCCLTILCLNLSTAITYAGEAEDDPSAGEAPEDPGDVTPLMEDGAAMPPNAPVLLLTDSPETADKLIARGMALVQGKTQHTLKPQPTSPPTPLIPLNADLIVDVYERRGHASTLVKLWPATPPTLGRARLLQLDASEDGLDVPSRIMPHVATWNITSAPDTKPPRWLKSPSLIDAPTGERGKKRLYMPVAREAAPSFVQLDIKPARGTPKTYTLLLLPDLDTSSPCHTFLALNDPEWLKQTVELTLTFIDAAGNKTPAPGGPIKLKAASSPALKPADLPVSLCVGAAP